MKTTWIGKLFSFVQSIYWKYRHCLHVDRLVMLGIKRYSTTIRRSESQIWAFHKINSGPSSSRIRLRIGYVSLWVVWHIGVDVPSLISKQQRRMYFKDYWSIVFHHLCLVSVMLGLCFWFCTSVNSEKLRVNMILH